MRPIRRALARMAALFRGHGSADEDLRAEMEAHLKMETEENIRRGMTPAEAHRQALMRSALRVRFGGNACILIAGGESAR